MPEQVMAEQRQQSSCMFVILFSALYIYCGDVRLENKSELTQQSLSIALQSEFLHLASARLHEARSQNVVPKASVL